VGSDRAHNSRIRGDNVNHSWMLCLIFTLAISAIAQEKVPEGFEHWTADSLKQIEQSLKEQAVSTPHRTAVKRLSDYQNDLYMLSRREADGIVEWHENQADVFFVESGSATLVVGGTMVGGEVTEPHEKRNGTIQGGIRRKLAAGDVVRIPPQVPHQILLDGSSGFTYFVIKVKGY
jgi:mannose-6-phosphate isomerase-like protein (cupin superfamily)